MALENSLRTAMRQEELVLLYQPQVEISTGRIFAVEALVYWQRSAGELTGPSEFIPMAEESGLIVRLGAWVLRAACEQMMAWRKAGFDGLRLSVNLSGRQFQQPDLVNLVESTLEETGLPAGCLELEITESVAMENVAHVLDVIGRLKALGVGMTMDDFGVGYSSLENLKRFPLDTLKIDRAFVRDMTSDSRDEAVVRAAIALARGMGLKVVAEGVETEAQRASLERLGCDGMQGFLFSRPVTAARFAQLLRAGVKNTL
jgi:EAL domain-containing protein (putative c-di-GMP-specific phosphodiesterase class I)